MPQALPSHGRTNLATGPGLLVELKLLLQVEDVPEAGLLLLLLLMMQILLAYTMLPQFLGFLVHKTMLAIINSSS